MFGVWLVFALESFRFVAVDDTRDRPTAVDKVAPGMDWDGQRSARWRAMAAASAVTGKTVAGSQRPFLFVPASCLWSEPGTGHVVGPMVTNGDRREHCL